MFHRSEFADSRPSLPNALFGALLTAHRAGVTSFRVLFADRLAPFFVCADDAEFAGNTIGFVAKRLMLHVDPADSEAAVLTMQPDVADRGTFALDSILKQWGPLIADSPNWQGQTPHAAGSSERNSMYAAMAEFDYVGWTDDATPYGNLGFVVNPSTSKTLASIPQCMPVNLAKAISLAGHSARIALVSGGPLPLQPAKGQRVFEANCTVEEMATAISDSWVPDGHVQAPDSPMQSALAFRAGISDCRERITSNLNAAWRGESCSVAVLEDDPFRRVLIHRKTMIVRCMKTVSTGPSLIMTNGVSCGF